MQKWKYKFDVHNFRMDEGRTEDDIQTMIDELNDYGAEGWELVTLVPHSHTLLDGVMQPLRKIPFDCYWKRPVEAGEVNQTQLIQDFEE